MLRELQLNCRRKSKEDLFLASGMINSKFISLNNSFAEKINGN